MPRYRSPDDQRHYLAARGLGGQMGLRAARVREAANWWDGVVGSRLAPDDIPGAFAEWAARQGWSPGEIDGAMRLHETIATYGPDRYVPQGDDRSDQAIIERAENLLYSDKTAYDRDVDLQEDYQLALERAEVRGSLPGQARPSDPAGPITNSPIFQEAQRSSDARRRGEIEQAMRQDGGREYWASPQMQAELAEILSRQVGPADAMDPSSIGTDSAAPAMGGSEQSGGFTVGGF